VETKLLTVVAALALVAGLPTAADDGEPADGNGCTSQDEDKQDVLEVHAGGAQVCYDGDVNAAQPGEDNPCPQRA
jgi:hypothetical protein